MRLSGRNSVRARMAALLCASAVALFGAALWHGGSARASTGSGRAAESLTYASPVELLFSPDGARLYVLCQGSDEVRVLDASTYAPIKNIPVGHIPRGFSFSPDGARLFVANTWDDTISVIDTRSLNVAATWPVGSEPSSVIEDRAGKRLYVANRISNDVAVLDAQTGAEEKRLAAGRGASYITPSPDGARLFVTHVYPNPPHQPTPEGNRTPPQSEITVIDTGRATVADRINLDRIAHSFRTAFSSDGRLGITATLHPKNLVPLAHMEHGAAFADTVTLFGADVGKPVELPLDELERYAARPFGVAISPDKSRIYVTCEGSEIVIVIDVQRALRLIHARSGPFVEDLSASAGYVITHIAVGHDPRGMTFTPDGRKLLVANRLEDTISVIDTRTNRLAATVPLAGPKQVSIVRHGEQTFYTSRYSFQGQVGCANCHIDSTFDGLTWDLEPDGFGRDIVDNRPIEDLTGTEPYKWNGGNPNLPTECGPRTEKYFWRSENYDSLTLTDLVSYVRSLPSRPNRLRAGRTYSRTGARQGPVRAREGQIRQGYPGSQPLLVLPQRPQGHEPEIFDVGTEKATDNSGKLDTPQLTNIAITAPYLHDGSARTLEEIWTVFNPEDKHGRTNDLTKDELNDLIEYLRTR